MKKLLSLLSMLCMSMVVFAQNTLVATLSHGEDVTMYYGVYALQSAMKAAVSGDIINLSGGGFQATDITKGVTLRGTGIDDATPSYISGNFTINVASDDANRLSMEGIRCTGTITMSGTFSNACFLKCKLNQFSYASNSNIQNTSFVNCKIIGNYFYLQGSSTVTFFNSYVGGFWNNAEEKASASFINCLILTYHESWKIGGFDRAFYIRSSILYNCIIYRTGSDLQSLPNTTLAINCVAINSPGIFGSCQNCSYAASAEAVFTDFTGSYSDTQTFKLSDEAKTKYLGTDGTEVGMHGGMMPYDSTPSYPQITKMKVANRTTADGKLSVEIEVSAAE